MAPVKSNPVEIIVIGGAGYVVTVDVTDQATSQAVAAASVLLAGTAAESSGATDASGMFVSSPLPSGSYLLTVTASGYVTFQTNVTVSAARSVDVSLVAISPGPGPNAFAFVSFAAGETVCTATWTNTYTASILATCYVTAKNSQGQTLALGSQDVDVGAGQTQAFDVPLNIALAPGTYEFSTFVNDSSGEPVSPSHSETDTV